MKRSPSFEETYLALRRTVGVLGALLPVLLILGNGVLFGERFLLHSISMYYHSGMRDLFVGALCSIGLFLFFYRGYDGWEDWAGNIAGAFAVGVAFFPTSGPGVAGWVPVVHYICAGSLFLTLSVYSVFLFPRRRVSAHGIGRVRTPIHRICGTIMVLSVAAIGLYSLISDCDQGRCFFPLVAETIALLAFGVSWIVEGNTLES